MARRIRRPARIEAVCSKCKHAIFDEVFGEYKCGIRHIRIYNPEKYAGCEHYEKQTTKNSATAEGE